MAAYPCMPFWTDAYLADTQHLTTEEHGAYLLLLLQAWRSPDCSLADDDDMLARHAKQSPAKWKLMKPIIMAFWALDKRRKRWVQKRLKKEREKVAVKSKKAKDSAASRWKDERKADANALPSQCYPKPKPEPEPKGFSRSADAQKKSPRQKMIEAIING